MLLCSVVHIFSRSLIVDTCLSAHTYADITPAVRIPSAIHRHHKCLDFVYFSLFFLKRNSFQVVVVMGACTASTVAERARRSADTRTRTSHASPIFIILDGPLTSGSVSLAFLKMVIGGSASCYRVVGSTRCLDTARRLHNFEAYNLATAYEYEEEIVKAIQLGCKRTSEDPHTKT